MQAMQCEERYDVMNQGSPSGAPMTVDSVTVSGEPERP
jgi:hypothetical protein